MKNNEDLHIFQYGGSGAMYFLQQLLLSNKFICYFGHFNQPDRPTFKVNYDEIRKYLFSERDHNDWKKTELPPDNIMTAKIKNKNFNRIFFSMNFPEKWDLYAGKKVLVYTDLKTQVRLSWYKKAFWFIGKNDNYDLFIKEAKEILSNNKNLYYNPVYELFEKADILIKFQDLLNEKTLEIELNKFGVEITQEHIDFMNHYKSLHTPLLLHKIGVEP